MSINYPTSDELSNDVRKYIQENNHPDAIGELLTIGVAFKRRIQNSIDPFDITSSIANEAISKVVKPLEERHRTLEDRERRLEERQTLLDQREQSVNNKETAIDQKLETMLRTQKMVENTPQGGSNFQDALLEKLRSMFQDNCTISDVSLNTGALAGRKTGDFVASFNDDHACANHSIVFEAKNEAGFTMKKAAEEIELAKRNRKSDRGIFVINEAKAPEELLTPLVEKDGNIFVKWSQDDPNTDAVLFAAFAIARKSILMPMLQNSVQSIDFNELDNVVRSIENSQELLLATFNHTQTIINANDKVRSGINKTLATLKTDFSILERMCVGLNHSPPTA